MFLINKSKVKYIWQSIIDRSIVRYWFKDRFMASSLVTREILFPIFDFTGRGRLFQRSIQPHAKTFRISTWPSVQPFTRFNWTNKHPKLFFYLEALRSDNQLKTCPAPMRSFFENHIIKTSYFFIVFILHTVKD